MKTHFIYLFLPALALMTACSSGRIALRNGNYDTAVERAVKRLNAKPGHTKANTVLQKAYAEAVAEHEARLRNAEAARDPFHWETVLGEYGALQHLAKQIANCSTCTAAVGVPKNHSDQMAIVRDLAAGARYNAGQNALRFKENRLAAKDAFTQFEKANAVLPNYRDAHLRAAEAFAYALQKVVIEPVIDVYRLPSGAYQDLQHRVVTALFEARPPSPFVRYLTPRVAERDTLPPQHMVQLAFVDYNPRSEHTSQSCQSVESSQEYVVGRKKINDSTWVDVKEKAKGTLTTYRKTVRADARMELRILDAATGRTVLAEPRSETTEWTTEWQTFSGDARALNGSGLKCASGFEPSVESQFDELSWALGSSLCQRLRRFYRDY